MINIHFVLLKLFEPVMDVQFSKVRTQNGGVLTVQVDKVDPEYFRHSKRLDIVDETKIRATKEEADEFFGGTMDTDSKPNFISDIFFLLNSIFHLGLTKTIGTRIKAESKINDLEKHLKQLESQSGEWAGVRLRRRRATDYQNPAQEAQGAAAIQKAKVILPA